MDDLDFSLVDESNFGEIPAPARPGARCQSCDYWEHVNGRREPGEATESDLAARERLKLGRLSAGNRLGGSYGMLALQTDAGGSRRTLGWAQFGPISIYPRAQAIRDRYPQLPGSPAPWVITCLQVAPDFEGRDGIAARLLDAVCAELDRRGVSVVEVYPELARDPWQPPPGPAPIYAAGGFDRAVEDERYPVYRRELTGATDEAWPDELMRGARQEDDDDGWPLPLPKQPDADDFFRLPPDRPKRPNPFGED
jgi:ribosomal protein S18 acetylase RimI-like enzyme